VIDDEESVVANSCVSAAFGGLGGAVDDGGDDVDKDEARATPGFVKSFNRRSLSSTLMPFEVDALLTILRFGTKIVGFLTVGSTAFGTTGRL